MSAVTANDLRATIVEYFDLVKDDLDHPELCLNRELAAFDAITEKAELWDAHCKDLEIVKEIEIFKLKRLLQKCTVKQLRLIDSAIEELLKAVTDGK